MFEVYGKIVEIVLKEGRDKYAFVEFENLKDAEEAFERFNF